MLKGRTNHRTAWVCALAFALCPALAGEARAQEWVYKPSTSTGPTIDAYVKQVGPEANIIAHGDLQIDGKSVNCGKRPTVINPNFDSWGGAFPGFLILNTNKISGLTTQVKLYIYSHECGHILHGPSETAADCYAVRRARREGWLTREALEDICAAFNIAGHGPVHPDAKARCSQLRQCFASRAGAAPSP